MKETMEEKIINIENAIVEIYKILEDFEYYTAKLVSEKFEDIENQVLSQDEIESIVQDYLDYLEV